MNNKPTTLPDLPSALIRVALADLNKAEATKNVLIEMDTFYSRHFGRDLEQEYYDKQLVKNRKYCCVCLAGAVMIGSLGADTDDENVDTTLWGTEIRRKLNALDHFRTGGVLYGINEMGLFNSAHVQKIKEAFEPGDLAVVTLGDEYNEVTINIPDYGDDKETFKQRLAYIADRLESVGY